MTTYYKMDGTKIRFREYWRLVNGNLVMFLIAAICKLLGIKLDFKQANCRIERLILREAGDLPQSAQNGIKAQVSLALAQKLEFKFLYDIQMLSNNISVGAAFLPTDKQSIPQVLFVKSKVNGEEKVVFGCLSRLTNGTLVSTSNQPRQFDPQPGSVSLHLPGASIPDVLKAHKEFLKQQKGGVPVAIDDSNIQALIIASNNHDLDSHIKRGTYVPMSEEEVERLRVELGVGEPVGA